MDDREFCWTDNSSGTFNSGLNLVFIEDTPRNMDQQPWYTHLWYAYKDCCKCCVREDTEPTQATYAYKPVATIDEKLLTPPKIQVRF